MYLGFCACSALTQVYWQEWLQILSEFCISCILESVVIFENLRTTRFLFSKAVVVLKKSRV